MQFSASNPLDDSAQGISDSRIPSNSQQIPTNTNNIKQAQSSFSQIESSDVDTFAHFPIDQYILHPPTTDTLTEFRSHFFPTKYTSEQDDITSEFVGETISGPNNVSTASTTQTNTLIGQHAFHGNVPQLTQAKQFSSHQQHNTTFLDDFGGPDFFHESMPDELRTDDLENTQSESFLALISDRTYSASPMNFTEQKSSDATKELHTDQTSSYSQISSNEHSSRHDLSAILQQTVSQIPLYWNIQNIQSSSVTDVPYLSNVEDLENILEGSQNDVYANFMNGIRWQTPFILHTNQFDEWIYHNRECMTPERLLLMSWSFAQSIPTESQIETILSGSRLESKISALSQTSFGTSISLCEAKKLNFQVPSEIVHIISHLDGRTSFQTKQSNASTVSQCECPLHQQRMAAHIATNHAVETCTVNVDCAASWRYVVRGQITCLLAPPLKRNLKLLQNNMRKSALEQLDPRNILFHAKQVYTCTLKAGDCLFIPSGWIHGTFYHSDNSTENQANHPQSTSATDHPMSSQPLKTTLPTGSDKNTEFSKFIAQTFPVVSLRGKFYHASFFGRIADLALMCESTPMLLYKSPELPLRDAMYGFVRLIGRLLASGCTIDPMKLLAVPKLTYVIGLLSGMNSVQLQQICRLYIKSNSYLKPINTSSSSVLPMSIPKMKQSESNTRAGKRLRMDDTSQVEISKSAATDTVFSCLQILQKYIPFQSVPPTCCDTIPVVPPPKKHAYATNVPSEFPGTATPNIKKSMIPYETIHPTVHRHSSWGGNSMHNFAQERLPRSATDNFHLINRQRDTSIVPNASLVASTQDRRDSVSTYDVSWSQRRSMNGPHHFSQLTNASLPRARSQSTSYAPQRNLQQFIPMDESMHSMPTNYPPIPSKLSQSNGEFSNATPINQIWPLQHPIRDNIPELVLTPSSTSHMPDNSNLPIYNSPKPHSNQQKQTYETVSVTPDIKLSGQPVCTPNSCMTNVPSGNVRSIPHQTPSFTRQDTPRESYMTLIEPSTLGNVSSIAVPTQVTSGYNNVSHTVSNVGSTNNLQIPYALQKMESSPMYSNNQFLPSFQGIQHDRNNLSRDVHTTGISVHTNSSALVSHSLDQTASIPFQSNSYIQSKAMLAHRSTCHRCGNLRKRLARCSNCPQVFCISCAGKMFEEHSLIAFWRGCPVCKQLCCCSRSSRASEKDCPLVYHCYKRCLMTRKGVVRPTANQISALPVDKRTATNLAKIFVKADTSMQDPYTIVPELIEAKRHAVNALSSNYSQSIVNGNVEVLSSTHTASTANPSGNTTPSLYDVDISVDCPFTASSKAI